MANNEKQPVMRGNVSYGGNYQGSQMYQAGGNLGEGYQPAGWQQGGYPPQGAYPQGMVAGQPAGAPYPPAAGAPGGAPYPPAAGAPYPPASGTPSGAPYPPAAGAPGSGHTSSADNAASIPSAPPMEKMDEIEGYGGNNFSSDHMAPPPSYEEATAPPARDTANIRQVPVINEAQAREALLQEVGRHCCWGKGPAEKLTIEQMNSSSAFHYTLETFTEARTTKWVFEPYIGQPIDGVGYGPAPMPWNVIVPSPTMFVNKVHKQEVPHTASVKPCHACFGRGKTNCTHCYGRGHDHCSSCDHGRSRASDQRCNFCDGHGRKRCTWCHGNGMNQCTTCQGRGSLKCYIRLTVTWTNHMEDRVVDLNNLPVELMRDVSGELAFQEENQRVWPISHFPDQHINRASAELVNKHQGAFPKERILTQRHKIRIIPVTQAIYNYEGKDGKFYIYGFEQKAYAPNYPSTCCGCCCVIL